jgi:hypothetical protein
MKTVTLNTNGRGYWSRTATAVEIVDIRVAYINDERDFGELRVYFNTDGEELGSSFWDVNTDGLIYTDKQFISELQAFLDAQSLPGRDVSYSEQGMQGDNYVSFDIGRDFINSWDAKGLNV